MIEVFPTTETRQRCVMGLVHGSVFCRRANLRRGLAGWLVGIHLLTSASVLAWPIPTSNTLVRFEIQRGTNSLGRLDVELFDHDKPETVRNFLLYVRSGAFSNSFLHRCIPGFVLQGGGYAVANPLSTNRFSTYLTVTNFGRLTNEFQVGPRLSNTFGTIAMAKVAADPNSATSQWFINLGNNSANLDNQNGGFTVFGRVLERTNANESTNVLRQFNSLSTSAGIVNLGTLINTNYQMFSDLPVAYTNTTTRVPSYHELHHVRISVVGEVHVPGELPPTINLLSPASNSRFTNQTVTLLGTASDDAGVARVVYEMADGPLEIAVGTTNWEAVLSAQPGFNTVTINSIDWDGLRSTNPAVATFLYVAEVPLNLQVIGSGSVSGATNSQMLQVGAHYTLTATPAKGYEFESWSGSVTSATTTLVFQVPAGLTQFNVTAKFVPNPLPQLAGTYHGLMFDLFTPAPQHAAFFTMNLRGDGVFSGRIHHAGGQYTYTGSFDSTGSASIQGTVGGIYRAISLQVVKTNAAGLISGMVGETSTLVQLERIADGLPAPGAPPVGPYTFVFPSILTNPPNPLIPGGNGYGTGALRASGVFELSGALGDGTAFSAAPQMTRLNRWPLYVPFSGGRGALLGWLSAPTNEPGNLDGSLQWMRAADALSPTYQAGFSNHVTFQASPLVAPGSGGRVLNWVHGLSELTGAGIVPGITNLVKLATNNTLSVVDANAGRLNLILDPPTGVVDGTFVDPWAGTTNLLRGVLHQRTESILGQFIQGREAGSLGVGVAPFLVTQHVASVTLPALTDALKEGGLIRFENGGEITFAEPIPLAFDTALDANGHPVSLSGGGTTRLLEVPGHLSFAATGITFANGRHAGSPGAGGAPPVPGGDGRGAGILNLGGAVRLTNCVLTNFSVWGGDAELGVADNTTAARGGRGLGAAICNLGGTVTLRNCLLADNLAVGGRGGWTSAPGAVWDSSGAALGAALFSDGGECEVRDSDFLRNRAVGGDARRLASGTYSRAGNAAGGALAVVGGSLRLSSSRCLANSALGTNAPSPNAGLGDVYGGAVFGGTNTDLVVEGTTFGDNAGAAGGSEQTGSAGAGRGGAVFNAGSLVLRECTLEHNTVVGGPSLPAGPAFGGAVASAGALVIDRCTFNDNLARGGSFAGPTTESLPGAQAAGGGIHAVDGPLVITNSTLAFNRAIGGSGTQPLSGDAGARGDAFGGGLFVRSNSVSLVHLTLASNDASPGPAGDPATGAALGGGIAARVGTTTLRGVILDGNTPTNLDGDFVDVGYNLSSDASYALTGTGSRINVDPLLGPLTTNGGPTRTMAILSTSPARDVVGTPLPPVDQRGAFRPQNLLGDIGAFEFVQVLPEFVVHPASREVRAGTNVTFHALALGPGQITYSWIKEGVTVPGATGTNLLLTDVQAANAGAYAAIAANNSGAVTSAVATLTVDSRPLILTQPADLSLAPGASTSLVVVASGPALGYTWYHDGLLVPDQTNAMLAITLAAPGVEGAYQVTVTNFAGSVTSRVASVTFGSAALAILSHPQSVTVAEGDPASFNVLVSGVVPFRYQWRHGSTPIPAATNSVFTLSDAGRANAGTYRVVVTNAYLALTSAPASLTVVRRATLAIELEETNLAITCQGEPQRTHVLLRAGGLTSGSTWSAVATNTMSGAGIHRWLQPLETNGAVYYRAVLP